MVNGGHFDEKACYEEQSFVDVTLYKVTSSRVLPDCARAGMDSDIHSSQYVSFVLTWYQHKEKGYLTKRWWMLSPFVQGRSALCTFWSMK